MSELKPLQKILKSEQGVSLPMIILAIAMISSGTLYIMELNKSSKTQFASTRGTSFAEMERRRIGAVLGQSDTCKLNANFGGKPAVGTLTKLVTSDGLTPFLQVGDSYYKGVLKVSSIQTRLNPEPIAVRTSKGLIGSKVYELVVTYSSVQLKASAGRPNIIIRIPMYMKLDGSSNVTDCYAMVGNTNVDAVISSACSPVTATAYKNSYTTSTSAATISDCNHDISFEAADSTDCQTVGTPATQKLFSSFSITSNILSFKYSNCTTGLEGAGSCATDQTAYNLSGSGITCDYPGGSRDGACAPGQILWHSTGASSTCITVNCLGTTEFIQKVDGSGQTCYTAPNTTCGTNEYVYQFDPLGTDQCRILPAWNVYTCPASNYGVKITRATTTSGGSLDCSPYNKAKTCTGGTTFMTGTAADGSAACLTF